MAWTKVDQTDYFALCVIDEELANHVREIATKEGKHFRDILRSAVQQREFRRESGLHKFWENLSPEERSAHAKKASAAAWGNKRGADDPE